MKDIVAKNIRFLMRIKNMAVIDLAQKTNLSRYQIENVLHKRSQNVDNLQKIAQVLTVSLDDMFNKDFTNLHIDNFTKPTKILKNTDSINPEDYVLIAKCCQDLLSEYSLQINKPIFDRWLNTLYLYKEMASSPYELKNMAKGILFYILEYEDKSNYSPYSDVNSKGS